MIVAISVVGKRNEPLYSRIFFDSSANHNTEFQNDVLSLKSSSPSFFASESSINALDFCVPANYLSPIVQLDLSLHSALDYIEEYKAMQSTTTAEMYLGLLNPMDEYRSYGYITPMDIKFILLISEDDATDDRMIREFMLSLHQLYIRYMLNPFSQYGRNIQAPSFEQGVCHIVNIFNRGKY